MTCQFYLLNSFGIYPKHSIPTKKKKKSPNLGLYRFSAARVRLPLTSLHTVARETFSADRSKHVIPQLKSSSLSPEQSQSSPAWHTRPCRVWPCSPTSSRSPDIYHALYVTLNFLSLCSVGKLLLTQAAWWGVMRVSSGV